MASKSYSNHLVIKTGKFVEEYKNGDDVLPNIKRSAENSPGGDSKKRSILGDLTNVGKSLTMSISKKTNAPVKVHTRSATKISIAKDSDTDIPSGENANSPEKIVKETSKLSVIPDEESEDITELENMVTEPGVFNLSEISGVPPGVDDFDDECSQDQLSEPLYAPYVFKYYKEREKQLVMERYMERQTEMNALMRAILIDWMVEVQESFELNHETLYLAVKLVDMYLAKYIVPKAKIQLVGATAALIASKYDERIPPLIDDFLYICDDSYSREELLSMECKILTAVGFDLGIPVSYRFLRRYARCSKTPMDILTLARYILETSLMDYELITVLDSKLGAAALLLAFKMSTGSWTPTLEYYSGYKEEDLMDLVQNLNKGISPPYNKHLLTIQTKYSHKVFFEVAKISPLGFD